jgi:hypothetical protein
MTAWQNSFYSLGFAIGHARGGHVDMTERGPVKLVESRHAIRVRKFFFALAALRVAAWIS